MSVLTAIIAIAILSSLIDWLFLGTPLADLSVYQFMNHNMWRRPAPGADKEAQKQSQMGASFLISILFGMMFVIFWTVFHPAAPAAVIAILSWFAILLPAMLLESVYLDLHPRYLLQRAAVWLIKLAVAGIIVGVLL